MRAFSEKQLRAERAKNYARNVKDMYMPRYGSSRALPDLPEASPADSGLPNRNLVRRGITAESHSAM